MNWKNRQADAITGIVLTLVLFGLVMIYSSIAAGNKATLWGIPAIALKQMVFIGGGLACFWFFSRFNYEKFDRLMPYFIWGVIALLLTVYLPHVPTIRGARSWVPVGPVSIQPSEFAKLGLIIYLAVAFRRRNDPTLTLFQRRILPALLTLLVLGLIALQGDKGMTLFIGGVVFLLWFIAGARLVHVGALTALFVIGIGILAWQTDYARHRITDYMEQWKEEPVESYQLRQGKVAMVSGGLWGTGIGGGMTTLPDRHTDFIFSIIGEETGFIGSILTLLAYSAIIALGFSIAFRCEDLLGTLLAAGITILIGSQAVLNLCVTTGVAPTTGIGLPLISYGGSSLVTTLAAVGILVNIGRNEEAEAAT